MSSFTTAWSRRAPAVRAAHVRRTRLLRLLAETAERPLVALVAPAGYGKTITLAQWAAEDGRDVAWMGIEQADNDPARLHDHLGRVLGEAPGPGEDDPVTGTLTHMMERLAEQGRPVLIVLDDVHHLRPGPATDLLVQLTRALPPGSQLAMAGRTVPPLRLGRLRAERWYAEFGVTELAFDADEVGQALTLSGAGIPASEVGRLVERTEGWPAGVYLSALALRNNLDLDAAPAEVSGDHAYIADYFRDEMLARQPADSVRFMMHTALLGQFSARMCDDVLEIRDSAARLAEMEKRNLFLVPLDHRREWYRYHRLFAEALVAELRRRSPDAERGLHLRAAGWHERNGAIEQVVTHLLASGDTTVAGEAISRYGHRFVSAGRIATVQEWLTALGPSLFAHYPPVAVIAAWVAALSGNADRAHQYLIEIDPAAFPDPLPDGQSSLEGAVALLRATMGVQGVDRMLADAQHAFDLEVPDRPWYAMAATVHGTAQLLAGDSAAAAQRFREVATTQRREDTRAEVALALAQLSLLHDDHGDHPAARRCAEQADELVAGLHPENMVFTVVTDLAAGTAALRAGQVETARHRLGAAVRHYLTMQPTAFPWLATQVALSISDICLALGDVAAARARLDDARRHITRLPAAGVLTARLQQLTAAVAHAGNQSDGHSPMALSSAEERVLRLLPTHLSLREIAEQLNISRHTVKTHVSAIYRKLQVSSRTGVVARARELRLLAD